MKRIKFDTGVKEYAVGGGVLRFHPADPNVYARLGQAMQKLQELETELAGQEQSGQDALALMAQADRKLKDLLGWVFGPGNDFDAIAGGVSLLAVTGSGRVLAQELLAALEPVLLAGAEQCAQAQAAARSRQ